MTAGPDGLSTVKLNSFFFFLFPRRNDLAKRVFLVRHGSHGDVGQRLTGHGPEGGLTPRGREEAAAAAETLATRGVAMLYASPRRRTQETAAVIGARCGLAVTTAEALDEIDFGDWTGRRFEDLAGDPAWDRWNNARASAAPPGGETMAAAVARAVAFVEGIATGPVACVSHCDVIRGVVAHYLGLSLDNLLRFEVAPASVTTLDLWPGGATVVEVNRLP